MAEEPGPVYRASKVSRGAAWVVIGSAAGMSVYGIVKIGGASTKAIAVSGLFALMAWAALRLEVRATPDALLVCSGRTTRRFPWADVRGFEIDQRTGRDISVLLKGNARRRLPIVEVATRRVPAETVRTNSSSTGSRTAASPGGAGAAMAVTISTRRVRIHSALTPSSSKARAARASRSRIRPRRMCSVPM